MEQASVQVTKLGSKSFLTLWNLAEDGVHVGTNADISKSYLLSKNITKETSVHICSHSEILLTSPSTLHRYLDTVNSDEPGKALER